jgi:hypothetical protein
MLGECFQIAVGGGDNADIGLDGFVAADALEFLILEQPEDFPLRCQWHVSNLVQKNRAAVALFEFTNSAAIGAGEGALLVAEQLALQQALGDRGAIDGKKRSPALTVFSSPGRRQRGTSRVLWSAARKVPEA